MKEIVGWVVCLDRCRIQWMGVALFAVPMWGLARGEPCDPVVLTFPPDGAVSFRVMQDFFWERKGDSVQYDFEIHRWNDDLFEFEPYLSYTALPESGKLTDGLTLPENRFFPPWFLDTLSEVQIGDETLTRAPILKPGDTYRWRVRVTGEGDDCWVARTFELHMDPAYRVGVNTHLSTPQDWWDELGYAPPTQSEIQAYTSDLNDLAVPYVFEGMLQAWGRDRFRDRALPPFLEAEWFLDGLGSHPPTIISQNMFQPYRVPESGGVPQMPELGTDYFTMFDPAGADAAYLNPDDYSVLPQYAFSRHDPRTRAVYLLDVMLAGNPLSWQDLFAYWEDVYCAYHAWKVDPDDPVKRQAILDAKAAYQFDAQGFIFVPRSEIQDAFAGYVAETVARYRDTVTIWHFGNEPNGGWHIDPRLYAHQLAVFSAAVRAADPDARVMAATVFPGNPAAVNGEIFEDGLPDFWWIRQFIDELIRMWNQGQIDTVPFDVAGLNFYLIREDGTPRDDANAWGRVIDWHSPGDRSCPADHTPCPDLDAQECQFQLFVAFYVKWRDELDRLTSVLGHPASIPIIIKETASISPSMDVVEAHLPRGIAFMHELGWVPDVGPASRRFNISPDVPDKRLRNPLNGSRIEAVLWFHYHLSQYTFLVEQAVFPGLLAHTPLWDAIDALNFPCAPRTVDAGPDQQLFCGQSTQLGSAAVEWQSYAWTPEASLDDPFSAQPVATPLLTTQYTLTQTNPCGDSVQDQVTVVVFPPLEPAFFLLWRSEMGLTQEMDVDDSGRIDIPDFVGYVNSLEGCPR